jgi:hypothetical protein
MYLKANSPGPDSAELLTLQYGGLRIMPIRAADIISTTVVDDNMQDVTI